VREVRNKIYIMILEMIVYIGQQIIKYNIEPMNVVSYLIKPKGPTKPTINTLFIEIIYEENHILQDFFFQYK
jgi:hypothetical protein